MKDSEVRRLGAGSRGCEAEIRRSRASSLEPPELQPPKLRKPPNSETPRVRRGSRVLGVGPEVMRGQATSPGVVQGPEALRVWDARRFTLPERGLRRYAPQVGPRLRNLRGSEGWLRRGIARHARMLGGAWGQACRSAGHRRLCGACARKGGIPLQTISTTMSREETREE